MARNISSSGLEARRTERAGSPYHNARAGSPYHNARRGLSGIALLAIVLAATAATTVADESVVRSKHDLSTGGPGPVQSPTESQVCIFCHAPHNASPAAPLWNRTNPRTHYRIYRSSTTEARVDQPGPESKMCLSCHDGSIALGMTLTRESEIPLNHPFMPTGPSNLTNDLSDDHPVGFRYDRSLANRDPQLRSPDQVDQRIHLGQRGEMECIACHDPHNNEFGDFLRIPDERGALCNTCHQMAGWDLSAHARSTRPIPPTLGQSGGHALTNMAENACKTCHVSHGAAEPERLLRARSYELCVECHNGVYGTDVLSVVGLRSGHNPVRWRNRHDPAEDPRTMQAHVDCVDCHNPHAVQETLVRQPGGLVGTLGSLARSTMDEVPGVSLAGLPVDEARLEYEVCFRCHSDNPVPVPGRIVRQRDSLGNVRRQFLPSAASAHPVAFAARNTAESPSLRPEVQGSVTLSCQDCHNNPDARSLGGGGPNGPHGSRYEFLLADRYETADFSSESASAYALCYRCHDRASILADESFSLHRVHIVDGRSPCSACHTAHGVSGSAGSHSHLINFDLAIVQGRRQFMDTGRFSGSCTLVCHGVDHVNFAYER